MVSRLRTRAFAILAACAAALSTGSHATPITIEITATVRWVDDFAGLLGGAIGAGTLLTGSYTYDPETADNNDFPGVSDYWHYAAPYGITVAGGGLTFAADPGQVEFLVEMVDDHYSGYDNYLLRSYRNLGLANGAEVGHISWQLDDPSMQALATDALPTVAPILSDWPMEQFFALTIEGGMPDPAMPFPGYYRDRYMIRADVTSAALREAGAVPEPGTAGLMAMGLALAGLAAGRKRAR